MRRTDDEPVGNAIAPPRVTSRAPAPPPEEGGGRAVSRRQRASWKKTRCSKSSQKEHQWAASKNPLALPLTRLGLRRARALAPPRRPRGIGG